MNRDTTSITAILLPLIKFLLIHFTIFTYSIGVHQTYTNEVQKEVYVHKLQDYHREFFESSLSRSLYENSFYEFSCIPAK